MSKGKKGNKAERNPLEGVTFDQLSEKEKQLARLILQNMESEVEPDAELSLPDAILKYAEENPDIDFSAKEQQLIDKLKAEKSGEQLSSEKPKASGPSFSELIADKAAEMREKRSATKNKSSSVKDDFLQVTESEHDVDNSLEVANSSGNKPKKPTTQTISEDTPQNRLDAVLGKAGVTMSRADKAIVTELIHSVGVMDGKSDRIMGKVGTKLEGVDRLIKNYPELKPHTDEFCQVFESAAKNPKTVKFMQENYLNAVREQFGATRSTTTERNVDENAPNPKEKPTARTNPKSSPLAITDGLETQEVNQEQAVDSVIFSSNSKGKGGAKNISASDAVDPITQTIRDEILKKQQELLKEKIAETLEGKEKEDFLKQDLTAIRSYLQTEEGKQAVDDVMKNPELRKQMHAIEREGYKTVHTQFQDSFRDVDWGKISEDKVRTTDVKDADGNPVCTLKETT
ncbi:MAG: Sca4 family protein, partial [Pseudomonadota bacterium]